MGIEWVIADTKKKIFYELGKGDWFSLDDMEAFQDLEYLVNELFTEVYEFDDPEMQGYWSARGDKEEMKRYVLDKVAPALYKHFKDSDPEDLLVFSECHGDDMVVMKSRQYRCIGSRYTNITSDELNRHIGHKLYTMTEEEFQKYDPDNKF